MKKLSVLTKKQRKIIVIVLVFVFLASIGFTYAYFSAGIAEQNPNDEIVTTGTLRLTYVDGPYIELNQAYPGDGIEKEFIVSNTGTYDTEYSINWKSLINEIERDELVISLECKRYQDYFGIKNEVGTCENMLPQAVGNNTSIPIKGNIPVEVGITHEYLLRIEFLEISSEQNYNQGKTFAGEIVINEYRIDNTNVPLIQSAAIQNLNLEARVIDNIGVVAYSVVDAGEDPGEWLPVSSNKNLEIETNVDDYDKSLWVKNQSGTVVFRDLTPEGTVTVDPSGGVFPEEEIAFASKYKVSRMSTIASEIERSIAGPLTYTLKYKQTIDLKDPIKEGHTFSGWNVEGTLSKVNGRTFVMGIENTDVVASWDTIKYKLTVNPNEGTWDGSTNEQEFMIDYGSTRNIPVPTRKGYTFTGWTLTEGTNSTLESTTFTMGSADCTLTATWTINSYPWIAYHNKQNINDNNYTLVSADTATGSANYNTQVTPSVKTYTGFTSPASQTITIDEDTTVPTKNRVNYNYTRNAYSVTYVLNGGTASGNPASLKYDQAVTLTSPSKTGHNFTSWSVSGAGSSVVGTTLTMGSANTTLTANYTAQTYTLSYNGNGGSTPAGKSITYGSTYGTLGTSTREGYTFLGWFTSASGGTQVTAATTVSVTSNQTLYAHWTANKYTINFTVLNGTLEKSSLVVEHGEDAIVRVTGNPGFPDSLVSCTNGALGVVYYDILTLPNITSNDTCHITFRYYLYRNGENRIGFKKTGYHINDTSILNFNQYNIYFDTKAVSRIYLGTPTPINFSLYSKLVLDTTLFISISNSATRNNVDCIDDVIYYSGALETDISSVTETAYLHLSTCCETKATLSLVYLE